MATKAMAVSEQQVAAKQNGRWVTAFWLTGVALFVMELGAGVDYVQGHLAALAPNFLGCLPGLGLTAWRIAESTFWNCGHLEATFQMMPLVTMPFILVGVALSMKQRYGA
jgi:hypothetical protein